MNHRKDRHIRRSKFTFTNFRKMFFPVDNGLGEGLSGTGYAALYDFKNKELEWHQVSQVQMKHQARLADGINNFYSSFRYVVIALFISISSGFAVTTFETSGLVYKSAPILVGLLLFYLFESWMISLVSNYPKVTPPEKNIQHRYFIEMVNYSIKYNTAGGRLTWLRVPYLGAIIGQSLLCCIFVPASYYFYLFASTNAGVVVFFLSSIITIACIPFTLWNLIFKAFLYRKFIKETRTVL